MFCDNCRESLQENAKFCSKCGKPVSDAQLGKTTRALWNPNAAANWSLLFTPAFGSYLQSANWQTLGEIERAKSAKGWFYFSVVMLAVYVVLGVSMANGDAAGNATQGLGFIYLIIWYFSSGRSQAKFVNEKFGTDYPRRDWGKPLLFATGAFICYFLIAIVAGTVTQHPDDEEVTQSPVDRAAALVDADSEESGASFGRKQILTSQLQEADHYATQLNQRVLHHQSTVSSLQQRLTQQQAQLDDYRDQVERYMMNHKMALAAIAGGAGGAGVAVDPNNEFSDEAQGIGLAVGLFAVWYAANNMSEIVEVADTMAQADVNVKNMESEIASTERQLEQAKQALANERIDLDEAKSTVLGLRSQIAELR